MRKAKAAEIESPFNQLTFAWEGIDILLRQGMDDLNEATTVQAFVQKLESKREAWYKLANHYLGQRKALEKNNQQNWIGKGQYILSQHPYSFDCRGYRPRPFGSYGFAGNRQNNTYHDQQPQRNDSLMSTAP